MKLMDMFTDSDLKQIRSHGIDPKKAEQQLESFKTGFPSSDIINPARVGDGILQIDDDDAIQHVVKRYEEGITGRSVLKFVPASGAATRMFKSLYEFRDRVGDVYDLEQERDQDFQSAYHLLKHASELPFSGNIETILQTSGASIDTLNKEGRFKELVNAILDTMDYGNLPKGLLVFHKYPKESRLACEEHLHEGLAYVQDGKGNVRIHFTVSPEHKEAFESVIEDSITRLQEQSGRHFEIGFSVQKSSTDTIAADENNQPFRDESGEILFRPGGHGALIENLNDLEGDIIFIKNIDNVVPERLQGETERWKKVLGGVLIGLERKVHQYLRDIDSSELTEEWKTTVLYFLAERLGLRLPEHLTSNPSSLDKDFFRGILDRPIRVCGMVRNEGEPGGGPFWVRNSDGKVSLQIVESAQINLKKPETKGIFDASTHFNPVDLVCSVCDYQGNPFDLRDFVDPMTSFISIKSRGGRMLKALELPGLWNGAMANWLTAFVEVPLITFNPVKTVNDLLRDQHKA